MRPGKSVMNVFSGSPALARFMPTAYSNFLKATRHGGATSRLMNVQTPLKAKLNPRIGASNATKLMPPARTAVSS